MDLVLSDISHTYGHRGTGIPVLNGIDLEMNRGQLCLLTGPSGGGKTTLLTIICGMMKPTSGRIEVFGRNLNALRAGERLQFRRRELGVVFQQHHLVSGLSVVDNVALPIVIGGGNWGRAREKALSMLSSFRLEELAQRFPENLSGGQQQRAAIARALVHDPQLIICDEPTAALDTENSIRVINTIASLVKERNKLALIVTHDPQVQTYADRVFSLTAGVLEEVARQPISDQNREAC